MYTHMIKYTFIHIIALKGVIILKNNKGPVWEGFERGNGRENVVIR